MKFSAKVIETISGADRDDKQPRIKLKVAEADSCFRTFIVPNADGLALDDEVVLLVLTKEQAAGVFEFANKYDSAAATLLADQLRPDPPPPWEGIADAQTSVTTTQPDDADTQEFRLGGTA